MQQYEETNYNLEKLIIPLEEEEKEENCVVEHVGYCQHYIDQGGGAHTSEGGAHTSEK